MAHSAPKLKLLFFVQLPPPYHGFTVMNRVAVESEFMSAFDVRLQVINFAASVDELGGKFSFRKIFLLVKYLFQIFGKCLTQRYDYAIYPICFSAIPFLRDVILLSVVRLFGIKIIYYAHGNHLPEFYSRSPKWLQCLIDNFVRAATAAIVVGENLKFNFTPFLPHERIFSVHNGIETFKSSPPLKKTKSHIQVLYLSNLTRTKGFFVLLEAIPKVIAHIKDIQFVFAGAWEDLRDKADAENFVREKQLQDFVVWKGPVVGEAKEQLFYESDIFVFPTFYPIETFGIVNLEAMQAGLPIITTGRAAIPEVVEDGVNGFLVPEQDPLAVAEKILLLAQDEHLRQRMRENNLKKFHQFYTKEKYAERLIRTIEQIHALHVQAHA